MGLSYLAESSCLNPSSNGSDSAVPQAFIEKAVLLNKSDKTLPRYTYFMLDHTQNRTPKGKLFVDARNLYEYTWIGNLPYARLVEAQGKPLKGKALEAEQARYEKAVADHETRDIKEHAEEKHFQVVDTNLYLEPLLTPAYTIREIRQETLAGNATHVIDCSPTLSGGSTDTTATRHVVLWITDSGVVLRDTYEVLVDEPGRLRGSHGEEDYQLIDGNLLPFHRLFHLNAPNSNTGDFEDTYSRFRRFNVSVHIAPAAQSSSDNPGSALREQDQASPMRTY